MKTVKESGVTTLGSTRWLAFYTLETPNAGYDIPSTEDYWRVFGSEIEAHTWLSARLHRMHQIHTKG